MKRTFISAGVMIVMFVLGACSAWAVPQLISYQGELTDANGPVTNPSVGMSFRIFDVELPGGEDPLWEESQTVYVQNGIYNVLLGSGLTNPSYGTLAAVLLYSDDLWLEVEVDGEVMSPRQRITSVGFALRAGLAEGAAAGSIHTEMIADEAITSVQIADGAIISKIILEDGPDSGLDADLLDGKSSADFAPSSHNHDARYYTKAHVDALEARISQLEALLHNVTRVNNDITFTGVNVRIVNGTGTTDGAVNGVGNLIVGYNELRTSGNNRTGSHNIVVGKSLNYSSHGGLVVGLYNSISGEYASVSGGWSNTASGNYATVSGGGFNTANNLLSSVSGGSWNTASGGSASISGGWSNAASGDYGSVSGGRYNIASGRASFVGGGGGDTATDGNEGFADYSAILGGRGNVAGDKASGDHTRANYSTVSGGASNKANGNSSSVSGGYNNTASGYRSSVSGGESNEADGQAASISGGSTNEARFAFASVSGGFSNKTGAEHASVAGGFKNTASGIYSSVSGGSFNTASGHESNVAGGKYNVASGEWSFVGGGGGEAVTDGNEAFADYSAILGGRRNVAGDKASEDHSLALQSTVNGGSANVTKGNRSSIAGGQDNIASGGHATVSGGQANVASNYYSSVGGGTGNLANGSFASISGGWSNTASGYVSSVSGGRNNIASGQASFVGGGGDGNTDFGNKAFGDYSAILGGVNNIAGDKNLIDHSVGWQSTVSGGFGNRATGFHASVSGGQGNTAGGADSSVSGGLNGIVSGSDDWRAGGLFQDQ